MLKKFFKDHKIHVHNQFLSAMNKKITKLMELVRINRCIFFYIEITLRNRIVFLNVINEFMQILATCCFSIKYDAILALMTIPTIWYNTQSLKMESLIVGVTYTGFLFLFSMFSMAAISGEVPTGIYVSESTF